MVNFDAIKSAFVSDLWLEYARRGAHLLYPKRKQNKLLKMLTLTSSTNFQEINLFLEERLTQRQQIIVWNNDYFKIVRLQAELGACIVHGASRYENTINTATSPLSIHFPFELLNLDFSSQSPSLTTKRLENEMISVEKTIQQQKNTSRENSKFVLLVTSIVNGHPLNVQSICDQSDEIRLRGWPGITLEERLITTPIVNNQDKICAIESILKNFAAKHGYRLDSSIKTKDLGRGGRYIAFSFGGIFVRS